MGLGGALIWTAVFRNIKQQYPKKKIIYVYKSSFRQFLKGQRNSDFVIYQNNKDLFCLMPSFIYRFTKKFLSGKKYFIIDTASIRVPFQDVGKSDKKHIEYKKGGHMVDFICDELGIPVQTYQPKIILDKKEKDKASNVIVNKLKDKRFICIEPNFKDSFTVNKAWFWDRWQQLVNDLRDYFEENDLNIELVQIGAPKSKILDGVIDLTNEGLSFRENAAVLEKTELFVGYMGGLVHLNKAINGKAVVLISGFESLELASYKDDINIYKQQECSNCGLLQEPCPYNRKCMQDISSEEVFENIISLVKKR